MWGESNRVVTPVQNVCPTSEVDLFILHYIYMSILQRSLDEFQRQWNFHSLSSMGLRSLRALWHEGVMSNPTLLDEVCDSAHLGIDQDDLVPEVEITSNNAVVSESLMQLDFAQLIELIRICPDPLVNDDNQSVDL